MSRPLDAQDPQPLYLVTSNEPLLLRDWLDQARRGLRDAGFEDIVTLAVESGFDWNELAGDSDMMSLFSSHKCRVLSLPGGKPGSQGGKAIQALCADPPPGDVYIFAMPALDRASRNAAWFKAIQQVGEVVEIPPVYDNQLVDWLLRRATDKGIAIEPQAAQFLAERTEGNLLAADQELEKLAIRFAGDSAIGFDAIEDSVAQSARYSHFVLVDACLAGKAKRALRILRSLRGEGYATGQLRWALQSTLEQLGRLKQAEQRGGIGDRLWQSMRIWRGKQRLYEAALRRLTLPRIERLLQSCAKLDRLGKGQEEREFADSDWLEVEILVADFSSRIQ
ncbi:MAG: DNA polymerase III subunit delta [Gammaproteobacteria bacterium]|nr:DNA polymerase III subunit delta [Gammaproteobacteria bacterium]